MYNQVQRDIEKIPDSSILLADINKFILSVLSERSEDYKKRKKECGPFVDKKFHLQIIITDLISACKISGLSDVKMIIILMKLYIELYLICDSPEQYLKGGDLTKLPLLDIIEQKMQVENSNMLEKYSLALSGNIEFLITLLYNVLAKKYDSFTFRFSNSDFFHVYLLSFYLNDCHMYSITDEEVETFETRWWLNFSLLSLSNAEDRNRWWKLAGYFYGLHKEIGDSCLRLDSIKIRNSMIEANWLKTFGQLEIEVQDLIYRKKLIEIQIVLKHQEQSLSLDQAIEKAKVELLTEQEILESFKSNSSWANKIDMDSIFSFSLGNDPIIQQYRQEAEYYFRIGAKLLHPDRRAQIINGTELTEEQNEELNILYRELMSLRESRSLNPIDMISGDYFSVNKMKRIVSQADILFKSLGLKLPNLKLMIIGESMDEQLKFLMNEYNLLQTELAQIQASIQLLYSDKEIYQKNSILNSPESIESTAEKFKNIIKSNTQVLETLKEELERLFEEN
jgi:hypothetical protein